jgi:hypothetical protein
MTLERILLQTIKFDLQVEHPYSYLLKFSKLIKGISHPQSNRNIKAFCLICNHRRQAKS